MDRGGVYPGVGNVLQGSGPGGAAICIRVVSHVGSDGDFCGSYTHRVTAIDHGKTGAAKPRWDVGDINGK